MKRKLRAIFFQNSSYIVDGVFYSSQPLGIRAAARGGAADCGGVTAGGGAARVGAVAARGGAAAARGGAAAVTVYSQQYLLNAVRWGPGKH